MVSENEKSGLFTAERLSKDKARLAVVVRALAEGMSIRAIAASQGCSVNTILAIKRRSGPDIETLKQELGRDALDVGRLALERMRDEMQDMPKASLPIIVGIMVDKAQLLTGAPTMRIQHDHSVGVADVADYIASLPCVSPVQPVGARDADAQKAAGAIELQDAASVVDAVLADVCRDSQSLVSVQVSEVSATNCTDSEQIPAETAGLEPASNQAASSNQPDDGQGAGGCAAVEGGRISQRVNTRIIYQQGSSNL